MRYGALEPGAKTAIFEMFLRRVRTFGMLEVRESIEEDSGYLARKYLDGRKIKNFASSPVDKRELLSMTNSQQVLDVHARFGQHLERSAERRTCIA
jgi:hypothetical protein